MKRRGRHSSPDPFAPTAEPAWLVVRLGGASGELQEAVPLAPGADLRAAVTAARDARMADGWACEEIGRRCAFFFCTQGGRRLMIGIERRDPALPREPLACYEFFSRR